MNLQLSTNFQKQVVMLKNVLTYVGTFFYTYITNKHIKICNIHQNKINFQKSGNFGEKMSLYMKGKIKEVIFAVGFPRR